MALTSRALAFVSRWFDEDTVHRTFEPLIADWQREWQDATPARRPGISIRACLAFLCAVIISTPKIALTSAPPAVTNQIAIRMVKFMAVTTVILMIPPTREIGSAVMRGSSWATYSLILFAVPSALTLAFPFAMTGAVDVLRRREPMPAHVERAALLKLCAVAIAFMVVFSGWVVPAASTAARRSINPPGMQEPLRTMGDLNTYELLVDPDRANVFAPRNAFPFSSQSATLTRELNQRAAIVALPLVLIWMRWRSLSRRRKALPALLATVTAIVTLFTVGRLGSTLEREWQLWAGISAWIPIVVFMAWGPIAACGRRFLSDDGQVKVA
jgi:hypothetical protein